MDIYPILASKPHNSHYLNRYINFITACQLKNINFTGYTEGHHICPKADDMFPEYKVFKDHKWNNAKLTGRQHFIAHIMLWKAYPDINSTYQALWLMSNGKWKLYNNFGRIYESLKQKISESRKIDMSLLGKQTKGYVIVHDKSQNKNIRIKKTDKRYINKEFFHHSKNRMNAIDYMNNIIKVHATDSRILSGELKFVIKDRIITNGKEEVLIKNVDVIPLGWRIGRSDTNVTCKNKIWIHLKDSFKSKRINTEDLQTYLNKGYTIGRNKEKRSNNNTGNKWMKNLDLNICKCIEPKFFNNYISEGWIFGMIKKF